MERTIALYNGEISYSLRKSDRAKRLRIAVYSNCDVVVTLPHNKTLVDVESYVEKKSPWICKKLDFFSKAKGLKLRDRPVGFEENRELALAFVQRLIKRFNKVYGFQYRAIIIKDHKTKWGSCSKGGTLNFNYRILFLPRLLAEYIVVHELCHLADMRHSARYWGLVEKSLSDYKKRMHELKKYVLS